MCSLSGARCRAPSRDVCPTPEYFHELEPEPEQVPEPESERYLLLLGFDIAPMVASVLLALLDEKQLGLAECDAAGVQPSSEIETSVASLLLPAGVAHENEIATEEHPEPDSACATGAAPAPPPSVSQRRNGPARRGRGGGGGAGSGCAIRWTCVSRALIELACLSRLLSLLVPIGLAFQHY